jgi:hypothetical protein
MWASHKIIVLAKDCVRATEGFYDIAVIEAVDSELLNGLPTRARVAKYGR